MGYLYQLIKSIYYVIDLLSATIEITS